MQLLTGPVSGQCNFYILSETEKQHDFSCFKGNREREQWCEMGQKKIIKSFKLSVCLSYVFLEDE